MDGECVAAGGARAAAIGCKAMKSNEAVRYDVRDSWLGQALVAATERGVCAILLGDEADELEREAEELFPGARAGVEGLEAEEAAEEAFALVEEPASGARCRLDVRGTEFQRRVWKALRQVPVGRTVTYMDVAWRIGRPDAVRAVAGAVGANVLAVAIPCHRVVRRDGRPAGYRWGMGRKEALLERELEMAGRRTEPGRETISEMWEYDECGSGRV